MVELCSVKFCCLLAPLWVCSLARFVFLSNFFDDNWNCAPLFPPNVTLATGGDFGPKYNASWAIIPVSSIHGTCLHRSFVGWNDFGLFPALWTNTGVEKCPFSRSIHSLTFALLMWVKQSTYPLNNSLEKPQERVAVEVPCSLFIVHDRSNFLHTCWVIPWSLSLLSGCLSCLIFLAGFLTNWHWKHGRNKIIVQVVVQVIVEKNQIATNCLRILLKQSMGPRPTSTRRVEFTRRNEMVGIEGSRE